jgi:hypothetical protein
MKQCDGKEAKSCCDKHEAKEGGCDKHEAKKEAHEGCGKHEGKESCDKK